MFGMSTPITNAVVAIRTLNVQSTLLNDIKNLSFISTVEALEYISTRRNSCKSIQSDGNVKWNPNFDLS